MRPGADLSAHGIAALLAEFLDRLDLRAVTLVQNDAGTAQLLEIPDARTLIPLDNPAGLCAALRRFIAETP